MAQQQYIDQAQKQYDVGYNAKVQNYKNQLADTLSSLEGQKSGINANYDKQVQGQNLNNQLNKNNTSNAILGRGLNNSSIAVSGLAENDAKNSRLVGDINYARTGALGQVDESKALAQRNMNATLGELGASREDAIQTLANQLQSEQWDRDYKNQQLALERQNAQASQAYQNAQLEFERQKYSKSLEKDKISDANLKADLEYIVNDPKATDAEKKQQLATMYAQYRDNNDLQPSTIQSIAKYFNQYNGHNPASGMLNGSGGTYSNGADYSKLFNGVGAIPKVKYGK